ncbi:MAG: glutathione S-transferase family protein [Thermoleophilaceae bacterium]
MSETAAQRAHFEIDGELSHGEFVRQASQFRDWVRADGSTEFAPAAGRYHLYVSLACPWSHRAVIVRMLKGLEDVVSMSLAHPYRDERGWTLPGGEFSDPVNGFSFVREAYEASRPGYPGRVSVPVLWDTESRRIVNNESADIIRMFNSEFADLAGSSPDLYPEGLREEIDAVNELIYDTVNNGVYRAGFANTQAAYDNAYRSLFDTLAKLEQRLSVQRFLVGEQITEADWRLFVTLVRFDSVYNTHFRCNGARIVDYENVWGYTRELYQQPGVAGTVAMDQIKRHYYTTHDMLNPKRIIPGGPERLDFLAPHGRG